MLCPLTVRAHLLRPLCVPSGSNLAENALRRASARARLPPRTFLGSYAGQLVDLRQNCVERLRCGRLHIPHLVRIDRGSTEQTLSAVITPSILGAEQQ
jgi:hypothetical protein